MMTAGNIRTEDIRQGDIHYDFASGMYMEVEVISIPQQKDGVWSWKAMCTTGKAIIDYHVSIDRNKKLYDHLAYPAHRKVAMYPQMSEDKERELAFYKKEFFRLKTENRQLKRSLIAAKGNITKLKNNEKHDANS